MPQEGKIEKKHLQNTIAIIILVWDQKLLYKLFTEKITIIIYNSLLPFVSLP